MSSSPFEAWTPELAKGSVKALSRIISLVENEAAGIDVFLQQLPPSQTKVIGITGPPGAGKSTLVDAMIGHWVNDGRKIGVLCIDPSSPFNFGALLGDRIRMSRWYNDDRVFIRSLATRGSLGGLHPHILEIADVMKAAGFDYIIVETVGVGQSEVEIAGLADCTVVVLVPEAGDEIQTMKAGLMEIADVFVVNKADRPEADTFIKNLRLMMAPSFSTTSHAIDIIKTVATNATGIDILAEAIYYVLQHESNNERRQWLLADKAYYLIRKHKMKGITKQQLKTMIEKQTHNHFNLYKFVSTFLSAEGPTV